MTRTGLPGTLAAASASLKDAFRRTGAWLAACACAGGLMASSLLLPVADYSDLPKFAASFCAGALLLCCFLAGAVAPAALFSSARLEGFQTFLWSQPRGRTAMTAGLFLSSGVIVAAFTAFLALLQYLAICAACALSPSGAEGLRPRAEFLPAGGGGETVLAPGGEKTFLFAPVPVELIEGGAVDCEIEAGLLLARPESRAAGSRISVRVLASGLEALSGDFPAAGKGRLSFKIPAETAVRGFELVLTAGPSPYDLLIPRDGLTVKGRKIAFLPGFLATAAGVLVLALVLAAFSAAGSTFMSFPFAVALSAGLGLALLIAPEAIEATRDIERAGLAGARYGGIEAPSWLSPIGSAAELLLRVFPHPRRLNPSSLLADGGQVPTGAVAAEGVKGLALMALAMIAALFVHRRGDDKQ